MKKLPHVSLGVPVKQLLEFEGEQHDNFFLLKMKSVNFADRDGVSYSTHFHLFTLRELINAVDRYHVEYEGRDQSTAIGYSHPCTFACKRNGTLVTVYFCKFKGDQVPGLNHKAVCGLFSAREMRRSKERVEQFFEFDFDVKPKGKLRRILKWIIGR